MVKNNNVKIKELVLKKHRLEREYDRKLVDKATYEKKAKELQDELNKENKNLLTIMQCSNSEKTTEVNKMAEQKKEEKKKVGLQPRANSYTTHILNTLKSGRCKSVDAVVERVDKIKPGRDKLLIKKQVKSIIYLVKRQNPERWTKYEWDEDTFTLKDKV